MMRTTFWGRVAPGLCVIAASVAAATFTMPARAADPGWYAGVDIGLAVLPDLGGEGDLNDIPVASTAVDQSGRSWDARLGFRFSKYFAMEAGWLDLGESSSDIASADGTTARATVSYAVRGPMLAFVPSYPFGRWEPFIKFGMLWQNVYADLSGTLPAPIGDFRITAKERGMKVFYGTGLRCRFGEHWDAKFELNWYPHLGDEEPTGVASVPALSLGAAYRF